VDFKAYAEALKATLVDAKDCGVEVVEIDRLLAHIDAVTKAVEESGHVSPAALEESRRRWEQGLENYRAYLSSSHDVAARLFESVIATAQSATRLLFAMNGAAAIAILAFLGHLASANPPMMQPFSWPLTLFTGGVALAGLVGGFTYLAQLAYSSAAENESYRRIGNSVRVVAIVFWLGGLAAFVWGLLASVGIFRMFGESG
jgi:hypothetical protein